MATHSLLFFIFLVGTFIITSSQVHTDAPMYDLSAPTECKQLPEKPLYGGGILKGQEAIYQWVRNLLGSRVYAPSYILPDLIPGTYYSFSSWVMVTGVVESSLIWANVGTKDVCGATVIARQGCWTFLKGGFFLEQPLNTSVLHFEDFNGNNIHIDVASASLQQFSEEQWRAHQQYTIERERKRNSVITVTNRHGHRLQGANIKVEQISRGFPFGVAISKYILGNLPYQDWFKKRFGVTVFENELKWQAMESIPGKVNYTIADQMLEFATANRIPTRGHNVLWQDPNFVPLWALNLTAAPLQKAANNRVNSVMTKYRKKFIHWDVHNENLHYDWYETHLGNPNASFEFYQMAQKIDPYTPLFFNDFKVVETCSNRSNIDAYIAKIKDFQQRGIKLMGMGLEGHFFDKPNPPFMRAALDKFATVGVPVWLTELDVAPSFGPEKQALYLERVLREGFAHPAVGGIVIWAAMDPAGRCWQLCLTDKNFKNTPAGDVVDKLLAEWTTGPLTGVTDKNGSFNFSGYLGTYRVTVGQNFETTISLSKGVGPQYFKIDV